MLGELHIATDDDIQKFITAQDALVEMNRLHQYDKDKAKDREAVMQTVLWHVMCIPIGIGAANCGLAAKWMAAFGRSEYFPQIGQQSKDSWTESCLCLRFEFPVSCVLEIFVVG